MARRSGLRRHDTYRAVSSLSPRTLRWQGAPRIGRAASCVSGGTSRPGGDAVRARPAAGIAGPPATRRTDRIAEGLRALGCLSTPSLATLAETATGNSDRGEGRHPLDSLVAGTAF